MNIFFRDNRIQFLLLILLIISLTSPAFAKPIKKGEPLTSSRSTQDKNAVIQDWLIVPIFYATNRASLGTSDSGAYSETANPKGLLFGVKNIPVPLPYNSPVDNATQTKMLWQRIHAVVKKQGNTPDYDKEKCTIKDKVLDREEIVPAFNAYRKETSSPENIIFVHGCCTSFDTVMRRAAMVASHTQAPVLVYDWVSPPGFRNYLVNETMISQTIDDFCKFITKVETILDPKEITFIGHSMGNELVDQAMVRRAELIKLNPSMPKFKEIIMSNADVDAVAFLKHGNDLASNGEKTRVYFSTTDKRLRMSTFVHGGFRRLGSPGELISDLVKLKNIEFIDITNNNTGHELPYWLVANMHRFNSLGQAQGFALKQCPGYLLLERNTNAVQEISALPKECICSPETAMVTK